MLITTGHDHHDVAAVPVEARATAAAALSTGPLSLVPTPRPVRASVPGLPTIEEIEKLSFIEKVALTS